MNKHDNIKNLIVYTKDGVTSKVIKKSPNMNITLFCMAKGTDISEHTSTKEGFVFVIEGNGTFTLTGEKIEMSTGKYIFMKPNSVHSLKADENTSFLLILT